MTSQRLRTRLTTIVLLALVLGFTGSIIRPSIQAAVSYSLLFSTSSSRSIPVALNGQTVSGSIYVFTAPDTIEIVRVRFYLDDQAMTGAPRRTEGTAPFDFAGGSVSKATPFDVTKMSSGTHLITAAIDITNGSTIVLHAAFVVSGSQGNGSTALLFSAPSLELTVQLNGGPTSRSVSLTTDTETSTSFSISDNVSWATVSRTGTSTPATVTVTVDPIGLVSGTYTGTVTATATNHVSAILPITLSIPGSGPDQIHLAWVDDPSTTLTIVWRTQNAADPSIVSVREQGESTWLMATGSLRPSSTQGTLHEVSLFSLKPGTAYEYRVSGPSSTWSQEFTTRTAPQSGPADFDAIYVADTGIIGRSDGLASGTRQIVDEIAALNPLVVLGGGDYAYFDHDKRFGTLDNTIDAWFNQMQPIISQSPIMPTYGNHETLLGENYVNWSARFPTPTGFDERRNYSFNIGDAHFVSIYAVTNSGGLPEATRNWIIQDIQAAKAAGQRWIIPYLHVSPFSEGTNHPSNVKLRSQLGPIFESLGVQLVVASHDQSYERTFPLINVPASNTPTSLSTSCYTMDDGVSWVKVSPGGKRSNISKDFSPWASETPPTWTAFRDNTMHHFLRIRVSASGTLRVEAFGVAGDGTPPVIQDSFFYTTGSCPPREPDDVIPPDAPADLIAISLQSGISLDWDDNIEEDLFGYHVYRSESSDSGYSRLTGNPVRSSTYTDTSVPPGITFYYRVSAVDRNGNESQTSTVTSGTRLGSEFAIVYSVSASRSNPVPLSDAQVSGNLYVFTTPNATEIVRVLMYLDDSTMTGPPRRTEDSAPYDFSGGSATKAKAFDTKTVADGTHTVTAAIVLADGTTEQIHASFTVANRAA